jgi:protocatechuate 3,4-dioxygenase beta subunit
MQEDPAESSSMSREQLVLLIVVCALLIGGLAGFVVWSAEAEEDLAGVIDENAPLLLEGPREASRREAPEVSAKKPGVEAPKIERAEDSVGDLAAEPENPEDAALYGLVRDVGGRAVANALVALKRDDSPSQGRRRPGADLALVETDEAGRFRIAAVAPGDWLMLQVRHERFAHKEIGSITLEAGRAKRVDVTLLTGDALSGRVLDLDGSPRAGVLVRVAPQDAFGLLPGASEEGRATTDAEGRFRIERLGAGYKRVWTEMTEVETGVAVQVLVRKGEGAEPLEFRLGPARSLRGRVVDDAGRGVPGAMVNARVRRDPRQAHQGPQGGYPGVETDAEGRFVVDGLPEGAYTLNARKAGFSARGAFRHARTGGPEVEIKIQRNPVLVGRVVDAATGEAVTRFRLLASATPDLTVESPQLEQHFDDPDGRFEFSLNRRSGQIYLLGRARGFAGGRVGPIAIGAPSGELILELERGVRAFGRVIGPEAQALAGARVTLVAARQETENQIASGLFGGLKTMRYHARTDAEGRWELGGVMPGLYRVEARRKGLAAARSERAQRIESGRDHDLGELRLQKPARVSGTVVPGERGARPQSVVLRELESRQVLFRGNVSPDGSYVVSDIEPGTYLIEVHRLRQGFRPNAGSTRQVTLGPGETLILDF